MSGRKAWALLAVVAVLLPAGSAAAQGPPAASVVVDRVRVERVERFRDVTGEIRSARRSVLASEQDGLVIELLRREGERVEAGEVIARLDAGFAEIDVERAKADVARRRAELAEAGAEYDNAKRDLDRMEESARRNAATQSEVDRVRTSANRAAARRDRAAAELAGAQAAMARSERELAKMTLRAPFAGRVVSRRTEIGQWVQAGDPVVELIDTDHLEAWVDVPERFINELASGEMRVSMRIEAAKRSIEAPILGIAPVADPLSRIFPVRVEAPNEDGVLLPGMSVVASVPTGVREDTMTVHKDAVLRDDAGAYVYFLTGREETGFVAMVARVEPLFAVAERVAVRAGRLPPDAEIVIEGNERLYPSRPVAPRRRGEKSTGI